MTIAIATGFVELGGGDDTERGDTGAAVADSGGERLIFWTACDKVISLTDAEIDAWRERGVDGFTCMVGRLRGFGGDQAFTGNPKADLAGASYDLQRRIRDSRIVERAAARGMKLYLGAYLANYLNASTPLRDWFDDRGWSRRVRPKIRDLAAAAKLYGFAGIAFDQELYPQRGGVDTATWSWSYPGNRHTEAEVRAKAKQRGKELMSAILDSFPRAQLAVYHYSFPGDWNELVQDEVNGVEHAAADLLHVDFWDGMTSVEGYGAVRFFDNIFYKSPHRGTWDSALTYNQNRTLARLSRELSNWDYASRRVHVSPFSWIDSGPLAGPFDDPRPPAYVEEQLLAFRKWSMGGEFANFVYGSLRSSDYSPYVSAMQNASSAGEVDKVDPTLRVKGGPGGLTASKIEGTAHDNLAIRAVRWQDDGGGSGVARLRWKVLSGDYDSGYTWKTQWSFPAADTARDATEVAITAQDIKGNASPPIVRRLP